MTPDFNEAEWNRWRGTVDTRLDTILEHTSATNGHIADALTKIDANAQRITVLEMENAADKARAESRLSRSRYFQIFVGSALTTVSTVLIMALSGAVHI